MDTESLLCKLVEENRALLGDIAQATARIEVRQNEHAADIQGLKNDMSGVKKHVTRQKFSNSLFVGIGGTIALTIITVVIYQVDWLAVLPILDSAQSSTLNSP